MRERLIVIGSGEELLCIDIYKIKKKKKKQKNKKNAENLERGSFPSTLKKENYVFKLISYRLFFPALTSPVRHVLRNISIRVPGASEMSSMAFFSSVNSAPLNSFGQVNNLKNYSSSSWVPFMASATAASSSSLKIPFASSSSFFQNGFSLPLPNFSGFVSKSRNFSNVYARAATEKSIYDFNVKVKLIANIIITFFFPFSLWFSFVFCCVVFSLSFFSSLYFLI